MGSTGTVTAVDTSRAMLEIAARRSLSDASGAPIVFRHADVYNLSAVHRYGRFDAAHVQRTLQHLQRPREAIREMISALRLVRH